MTDTAISGPQDGRPARRRPGGEAGFTLVELLVGLMLSVIVFGSITGVLITALKVSNTDQQRNDNQDNARSAIDQLSRYLRNIASPSAGSSGALEKAAPYDAVFQSVSSDQTFGGLNASNQMRVRFCLDATQPASEDLWLQTQTWTTAAAPAVASTATCPSSAWGSQFKLLANVTNESNARNRVLFTYAPIGSTSTTVINGVLVDLFLNPAPTRTEPGETEIRSGIYLRNSNAPPTPAFAVTEINGHMLLNGTQSSDPNGQTLSFQWSVDGANVAGATTQSYDAGTFVAGSNHTFGLTVTDSAGLSATASPQTVTVQ